jgi:hypothetical protein
MSKFLARFVAWLLRQIEFPGKWPVKEPPATGYNRVVRFDPSRPRDV